MKKLKQKIIKANKDPKKELIILISTNISIVIFMIITMLLVKNPLILIYFLLIIIFFNFYFLTRYDRVIQKSNKGLVLDFIDTFSYFRIYISNNMNVYQAFKQISFYTTPYIKMLLDQLLKEIDNDKSLKPYINFASNFNNEKVEEVMIAIYQMVNEGNNETYLNQFVSIFETFKERVEKTNEQKREARFNTINQCSLVGSGVLMVAIMLGIVNLLGAFLE